MKRVYLLAGAMSLLSVVLSGCDSKVPPPQASPAPAAESAPDPVAEAPAAEQVDPPHSSPHAVIRAFFHTLETEGPQKLVSLVTPRNREMIKDPEWIKLWTDYRVTELGEEPQEWKTTSEEVERTVRVPVVYTHKETGEILKETIMVSQIEGRWFWDEK